MLDWIGTLRIRTRSTRRLELTLNRSTAVVGWVVVLAGLMLVSAVWSWDLPRIAWLLPAAVLILGALLSTMERHLVFDQEDGVLPEVDQVSPGVGGPEERADVLDPQLRQRRDRLLNRRADLIFILFYLRERLLKLLIGRRQFLLIALPIIF